jgi:alkanesulfonate monooxygenase
LSSSRICGRDRDGVQRRRRRHHRRPGPVEAKLREYIAAGVRPFILSGYPRLEECRRFGELVMPRLRGGPVVESRRAVSAPPSVAPVT